MSPTVPSDPPPAYTAITAPTASPSGRAPHASVPLNLPALNILRRRRVILASASPRRRALLAQIGLTNIEIIPSRFPETLDKRKYTPFEYVSETAHGKCQEVYVRELDNTEKGEPGVVIAADTVVVTNDGRILEKPRSRDEHLAMLKSLRDGGGHQVCFFFFFFFCFFLMSITLERKEVSRCRLRRSGKKGGLPIYLLPS